jgi:formylglycine-generating enzyme required for sulfatase activity
MMARSPQGRLAFVVVSSALTACGGGEEKPPVVPVQPIASPSADATSAGGNACPARMAAFAGGTIVMPKQTDCRPNGNGVSCDEVQVDTPVAPFCLDVTEVTIEAFAVCVQAGKCNAKLPPGFGEGLALTCNYGRNGRANNPMNCVDWGQANLYCTEQGKRLPTSAEWEWAATGGGRGKSAFPYAWGSGTPAKQLCWSGLENRIKPLLGTCPVGSFDNDGTNGVHDLAGNVSEWVSDETPTHLRRIRGGNWSVDQPAFVGLLGDISAQPPDLVNNTVGFRCANAL